jgi:hypothetical protein
MSKTHQIKINGNKRSGYAIVDREIAEKVEAAGPWFIHKTGYIYRNTSINGKAVTIYLHRFILDLQPGDGLFADHIDGNKLNNTSSNLRAVTHAQNNQNITKPRGSSRFRGVSKQGNRWQAQVCSGKKRLRKIFSSEKEAALWADAVRREHHPYATPDPELERIKATC